MPQQFSDRNIHAVADRIADGYRNVISATRDAQVAATVAAICRRALEKNRATVLLIHADNMKQFGSNEAARSAKLDEICMESRTAADEKDAAALRARHALDLANLDLDAARAQLRIIECVVSFGHLACKAGAAHIDADIFNEDVTNLPAGES